MLDPHTKTGYTLTLWNTIQLITIPSCKSSCFVLPAQVFVAMMQPNRPLSNAEVAQDAPSGMMTIYVDPRTGQAWVSGDISNVQNMTAVTLNAVSCAVMHCAFLSV